MPNSLERLFGYVSKNNQLEIAGLFILGGVVGVLAQPAVDYFRLQIDINRCSVTEVEVGEFNGVVPWPGFPGEDGKYHMRLARDLMSQQGITTEPFINSGSNLVNGSERGYFIDNEGQGRTIVCQ